MRNLPCNSNFVAKPVQRRLTCRCGGKQEFQGDGLTEELTAIADYASGVDAEQNGATR